MMTADELLTRDHAEDAAALVGRVCADCAPEGRVPATTWHYPRARCERRVALCRDHALHRAFVGSAQ